MFARIDPAVRQAAAFRALALAFAWIVIAGPVPASLLVGLPAVALATWASLKLTPPSMYRFDFWMALRFFGYFILASLHGGWDVARRTFAREMPIKPGQMHYTASLPEGLPTVLFASCVSLTPGTLSQRLDGNQLLIHVLDSSMSQHESLERLENYIAAMLGIRQRGGSV